MSTRPFQCIDVAPEDAETIPGAPLEVVLRPGVLESRPARPHDNRWGIETIRELMRGWSADPATILQSLADTILKTLQCDSSGTSLVNESRTRFWWPAVAGVLAPHVGGGTPLNFGPCGDVMNSGCPLLQQQPHLRYTYLKPIPTIREVLLVPFWEGGQFARTSLTGTIWAVIHVPPHDLASRHRHAPEFDREDLRMLETLGDITGSAYRIWASNRPAHAPTHAASPAG